MSRATFWCIVITPARGAALMFAVKVAKNIKNFEKIFFQKNFFFKKNFFLTRNFFEAKIFLFVSSKK